VKLISLKTLKLDLYVNEFLNKGMKKLTKTFEKLVNLNSLTIDLRHYCIIQTQTICLSNCLGNLLNLI
jgi:hypothetical protein